MTRLFHLFLTICMALGLASCGYHFTGEGEGPKPGLRLVAVPVFENKTSEPDLGALFAGALRREFNQKGPIRIVPVEEAEAVFKGTVKSIFITPVAHHPTQSIASDRVTIENRVYVTVDVRCEEKGTGKVLWRDPNFQYYKVYRLSDDPLVNPDALGAFENRRVALEYLAREMAIRIHDRFLSNF
ncbi:MAG: LptE family protein [Syntrophobacteraceae bacterium]